MEKAPQQEEEKLIPTTPHLRYMEKTLSLLESHAGLDGETTNWKDLYKKVGNWESGLELTDEIREVVREYLLSKFPRMKEKMPSISVLSEPKMFNALSHGWFDEEMGDEVGGSRTEILLAVVAHITKKIETRIYTKILEGANDDEFQKIGLPASMRQLLIDSLEASVKADPLFIRFLAYSQLSPKAPEGASPALPVGRDGQPHRYAELFPHETQYIAKRYGEIAGNDGQWKHEPGADEFREYIRILSDYFSGTDIQEAVNVAGGRSELEKKVMRAYAEVIESGFPIIIPPPFGSNYKPPYFDPELRVTIRTTESVTEEERFRLIQGALADKLEQLGVGQFADEMRKKPIRIVVSMGAYGAGITFTASAETDKEVVLYLNDQIRAYDQSLKPFFPLFEGSEAAFAGVSDERIRQMSREDTMSHEFSHTVYNEDTPQAKKVGPSANLVLAEMMAESVHRGLAKDLIENGDTHYTPEQYAIVTIGMMLQTLDGGEPDSEYYQAAVYVLNSLFEKGIVEFDGSKIHVKDHDALFEYLKDNAKRVIAVYEDPDISKGKAKEWVAENGIAGVKLQEVIDHVQSKKYDA